MYLSSMSACNKSRQSLSCPVDTTSKISYNVVIPFVFPANFHWKPNNKKKALKTIKMNTIAFKVTINMKKTKTKTKVNILSVKNLKRSNSFSQQTYV